MTPPTTRSARLVLVAFVSSAALAGCSLSEASSVPTNSAAGDTVYFGVSAPVTGQYADYGRLWKQGFDLALDSVNAHGGIGGKKVALKWEDSQSDPKQTVPIAQKFVADSSIIAELGDFSSPASIAASPTYTAGKLVQFGFTNSSPDFTKGGEYQWSPCLTQTVLQKGNAELVRKHAKKVAVVYQETDWGKQAFDIFSRNAAELGLTISYSSSFLPDSTDLRPILIKARDSAPEAVVHLGYGPDGALIVKQLRDIGFTKQFFGGQNTPEFISLAGAAAEGDLIVGTFSDQDPAPYVQTFVKAFKAKYPKESAGEFNAYAYDALIDIVTAARQGGATRAGVLKGLHESKKLPSVQLGDFTFDANRRPSSPHLKDLKLVDGKFSPITS